MSYKPFVIGLTSIAALIPSLLYLYPLIAKDKLHLFETDSLKYQRENYAQTYGLRKWTNPFKSTKDSDSDLK
ncbi:hypothetical protein GJ496_005520 [Pomphorhynchus laevis]|nr:hypothetical protein GJ496_005520 [Pomphorhynchus laevis]